MIKDKLSIKQKLHEIRIDSLNAIYEEKYHNTTVTSRTYRVSLAKIRTQMVNVKLCRTVRQFPRECPRNRTISQCGATVEIPILRTGRFSR